MSKDYKQVEKGGAVVETVPPTVDEKPKPMNRRWVFFSEPNGHAGFGTVVFRDSRQVLIQGPNGPEQTWVQGVRLSTFDLPTRFETPAGVIVCRELNLDKNPTFTSANPPVNEDEFMGWLAARKDYQDGRVFTWAEYLAKVDEYNEAKSLVRGVQFNMKRVEDDKGRGAKRGSTES